MRRVALVELPALQLLDHDGLNWTALRRHEPLGSKQILAAQLADAGWNVSIVNLKAGDTQVDFGQVQWRSRDLTKVAVGADWRQLDARSADIWGITVNYLQERDLAARIISHLAASGAPVVVGGSDALADPEFYLRAGTSAVVIDKSGAANLAAMEYVIGSELADELTGVVLPDGRRFATKRPPMKPSQWPLPPDWAVCETLGTEYWEAPLPPNLLPIGAVMLDIGCDRHCDFCQTPTYRIGYGATPADRAAAWLAAQKRAGAKSVIILSDQFLGRILRDGGRRDILEIMSICRELDLAVLWGNGLELSKATRGRGMPKGDPTPDDELIEALWGWDMRRGCAQAYIPAERPVIGTSSYQKLLPWGEHRAMMRRIVAAGVPDINYGVIVGLPEDSHETLRALSDAVEELRDELKAVNADLRFRVTPYAIRPLPGTPQARNLADLGLIRFTDTAIVGGFWTACADTRYLSYAEVSDWQLKLIDRLNDPEPDWQGITGLQNCRDARLSFER